MPVLMRRGMTLVELLVALVLFGIVSAAIYRATVTHQRAFESQVERIGLAQNLRATAAVLPPEIRELDAADGDILSMSATSLTVRAFRQFGILCAAPSLGGVLSALTFTVRTPLLSATRPITSTDSLILYYEGSPTTRTDDGWVLSSVTATAPQACPDGAPGLKVTGTITIPAPLTNTAAAIPVGAPVRGFEIVTYKLYQETDNKWYLGLQPGNGVTQPLIGPLTGAGGLTFTYWDANGVATATRTSVAQIRIVVRAQTAKPIYRTSGGLGTAVDSVSLVATLRNNPRFP
jgi:prepilin-type N-terminal cleavage/methylation domain-containing protein